MKHRTRAPTHTSMATPPSVEASFSGRRGLQHSAPVAGAAGSGAAGLSLLTQGLPVQVTTLLPQGATPHDYALKPSDLRALMEADLVVWLGEDNEEGQAEEQQAPQTTSKSFSAFIFSFSKIYDNSNEFFAHEKSTPTMIFSPCFIASASFAS